MTKDVNGDVFSDLTTSVDPRQMNADDNRLSITKIVIHHNATTNAQMAVDTWLTSGSAGTSAHYEITPTQIIGCVGENRVAYHAGNYDVNQHSIGLEHVDSTGAPDWSISDDTMHNSAKLIADICHRYGIDPNSSTIVPHSSIVATACPGGMDMERLIQMARSEYFGQISDSSNSNNSGNSNTTNYNQLFRAGNDRFYIGSSFKVVEKQFIYGIQQVRLAGITLEPFDWFNNGVPTAILNDVSGRDFNPGDLVQFKPQYNNGTIDEYSDNLQGCRIQFLPKTSVWFDSKSLWNA